MSGSSIGGVVGGIIGGIFGQPQIGMIAGSWIGGVLDPTIIKGPSIGDAQAQTSQAGAPIPKCYGHTPPIAVTLIDGDKIARKITRTEDVGKGATQKTETEHFIATRAFLVCEGEISGLGRITRNGKLVYSTIPGDELEAESASFASQITIYTGTETQGPDPSLEALHGVGNTHYYRGRAYFVVRDDEEVGGAMNRYMVEVMACGEVTTTGGLDALGPEFHYLLTATPSVDISGHSRDPVPFTGGVTFSSGGVTFDESGSGGGLKAAYTDGLADGLSPASEWSVFAAVKVHSFIPDMFGDIARTVTHSVNGWYNWALFLSPNGLGGWHFAAGANNSAGAGDDVAAPTPLGLDTDYVIGARVREAMPSEFVLELLVNGAVVASTPTSGTLGGAQSLQIGDPFYGHSANMTVGNLIGVRRAVSSAEAALVTYYSGVVPVGYHASPDSPGLYVDDEGNTFNAGGGTTIGECAAVWKDIVADIANRASPLLPAVLDIDHMTDEVPGFVLGNASLTGSDYVRTLCTFYFVDLVEYDGQLHAVRRGGPIVSTFTEDDLLDVEEEDDDTRAPALEAFKRITVMYPDPANKYVATPQTAPRTSPDITTSNAITLQCPIPFDAETMARKADIIQKIAFLQVEGGFKRAFPAEFSRFVPSDPVMFNDRRYIIVKASYDDSMVRFECQYDRPSAYNSLWSPGIAPSPSPQTSNLKGPTILVAMNLPPLRSADNVPGIYVAATGLLSGWPGCDVMLSVDGGESELKVATITKPAEIGVLVADVDAGDEPILVSLYGAGELESISLAQLAARGNAAAITTAGVSEVLQFQTAAEDSNGDFVLTDLDRGQLGTDDADHFAGDTFATLLNAIFIPIDASYFGQTLILRGVTRGTAPANNPTISLVYQEQDIIVDGGEIT